MIFIKNKIIYISFLPILISFLISGCYSFYEISKDEYLKKEKHNKTKIVLESKQEIIINESENFRFSPSGDAILLIRDSSDVRIALTDINKIMEQDYDLGKTYFAIFWSILGSLVVIAFVLIQIGVTYR